MSIYNDEMSILSKDGFGDLVASATATEAATASNTGAAKTTTTQKTSAFGSGTATAGTASASSTGPVTIEKGAAGVLGVDMLSICGGLAVGVVGAIMAL